MANLKNITELPLAESADGLNLIVNDNGAAKQIAASAVGNGGGLIFEVGDGEYSQTGPTSYTITKNYDALYEAVMSGKIVYISIAGVTKILLSISVTQGFSLDVCTHALPGNDAGTYISELSLTNGSYHNAT